MRCMIVLLFVFCSLSNAGAATSGYCNQSYSAQLNAAIAMKYDRCQYKRIGDDLVGYCTTWDEKTKYERIERGHFTAQKVKETPTAPPPSYFDYSAYTTIEAIGKSKVVK